ncbi:MAG: VOC family protein [Phycisphaerales bacterium]|nr:VOC family protein [Phycisphaerales bacterium]
MPTKIFVNLPVEDLNRSMQFFRALGFSFNPQFTDDTGACMVISEDIYAMLLTHDKFRSFSPNPISDATKATEVLICLSRDSRDGVEEIVKLAIAAGAKTYKEPEDHGFMYGQSFQDLDGHIWEWVWMDPSAMPL